MKNEIYNVDFFINKFKLIPEEKWFVGAFMSEDKKQFCAFGHCGNTMHTNPTQESQALYKIFSKHDKDVVNINDGHIIGYPQPTPKQRILAALYDIRKAQKPFVVTRLYEAVIVPVKIDESILIKVNEN